MKKFIDKILAATGNIRAMERLHVDDHTEAIINDVEMEPFAMSDKNVLYAGPSELGGYYFLQTIVVGTFNIKTKYGAKLILKGEKLEIELDSDMVELESDFSNVSNRFITNIDFQIEKSELDMISRSTINSVKLSSKKAEVEFEVVAATTDEEE